MIDWIIIVAHTEDKIHYASRFYGTGKEVKRKLYDLAKEDEKEMNKNGVWCYVSEDLHNDNVVLIYGENFHITYQAFDFCDLNFLNFS